MNSHGKTQYSYAKFKHCTIFLHFAQGFSEHSSIFTLNSASVVQSFQYSSYYNQQQIPKEGPEDTTGHKCRIGRTCWGQVLFPKVSVNDLLKYVVSLHAFLYHELNKSIISYTMHTCSTQCCIGNIFTVSQCHTMFACI